MKRNFPVTALGKVFLTLSLLGNAHAATLALYANTTTNSANSNSQASSQTNGAAAITDLAASTITGSGLNANGTQFFLRDQVAGQYITTQSAPVSGPYHLWLGTNSQSWTIPATPSSTSHYLEFTLTASGGKTLNLSSLTFDWNYVVNNNNATPTAYYQLFASVDGGAYSSLGVAGSKTVTNDNGTGNDWGGITSESVDLSGISDMAQSVSFRLGLGNDAANASYLQFFRDISVNGEVVPEPSAALLGACSLLVLLRRRRQVK